MAWKAVTRRLKPKRGRQQGYACHRAAIGLTVSAEEPAQPGTFGAWDGPAHLRNAETSDGAGHLAARGYATNPLRGTKQNHR